VSDRAASTSEFRGDVDGLRAVAILLVVGFHVGLPLFEGGFIGVDVFFVISGYLITRNLLRESEGSGRVALGSFWGRRIRRLVPAMALMLVVTLAIGVAVIPRIDLTAVARQAGSAALYVSNILFARDASDYFAADVGRSPYLHTWSLGVEEQFYLVWPLLVALGCVLARRRPQALRRVLGIGFSVVLIVSFVLCVELSRQGSSWAFFGLPARAWEFAAAGLLALVPVRALDRGRVASTTLAVLGFALLAAATVLLSADAGYPGARALAPVTATILLVVAGTSVAGPAPPLARALALRPLQWLGRVSYSWYLWHWPFIVLLATWLDDDRVRVRIVAALVALPVAAAAHHLVENPLRFNRRITASLPRTYALGAIATLLALGGTLAVTRYADWKASSEWLDEQLTAARADLRRYDCPSDEVSPSGIEYCGVGDPKASKTVMLIGDSHARHWTAALSEVAERQDLRLVTRWRGDCPAIPVAFVDRGKPQLDRECVQYRDDTVRLIDELHPDLVVISQSNNYAGEIEVDVTGAAVPDAEQAAWIAAYEELLDHLGSQGIRVALVRDNPVVVQEPLACLSRRRDVAACTPSRAEALRPIARLRDADERMLAQRPDVPTFDLVAVLCDEQTCAIERDGTLVYSDESHLTEAFTRSQEPELVSLLERGLG
jgi:peptidoglycan/LPS O-acetylase OafA/YrhL